MMTIPSILFPVFAFVFAVVFGRIVTIFMDTFVRKDEVYMDVANTMETLSNAEDSATDTTALRRS